MRRLLAAGIVFILSILYRGLVAKLVRDCVQRQGQHTYLHAVSGEERRLTANALPYGHEGLGTARRRMWIPGLQALESPFLLQRMQTILVNSK